MNKDTIVNDSDLQSVKVLIIDDSPIDRYVLRNLLEKIGTIVAGEAYDLESTMKLYAEIKPDITLLDIIMPNDNGIYILKKLMAYDKNAKIIMCTSEPRENLVISSTLIGAKHFLAKPVSIESIRNKIKTVISQ